MLVGAFIALILAVVALIGAMSAFVFALAVKP